MFKCFINHVSVFKEIPIMIRPNKSSQLLKYYRLERPGDRGEITKLKTVFLMSKMLKMRPEKIGEII
jgi:hypothetical protein